MLRVLDQVQGFLSNTIVSIVVYYFIQLTATCFSRTTILRGSMYMYICVYIYIYIYIYMLRVLDQVQGFLSNATLLQ
jgi:hypothetical protein